MKASIEDARRGLGHMRVDAQSAVRQAKQSVSSAGASAAKEGSSFIEEVKQKGQKIIKELMEVKRFTKPVRDDVEQLVDDYTEVLHQIMQRASENFAKTGEHHRSASNSLGGTDAKLPSAGKAKQNRPQRSTSLTKKPQVEVPRLNFKLRIKYTLDPDICKMDQAKKKEVVAEIFTQILQLASWAEAESAQCMSDSHVVEIAAEEASQELEQLRNFIDQMRSAEVTDDENE